MKIKVAATKAVDVSKMKVAAKIYGEKPGTPPTLVYVNGRKYYVLEKGEVKEFDDRVKAVEFALSFS